MCSIDDKFEGFDDAVFDKNVKICKKCGNHCTSCGKKNAMHKSIHCNKQNANPCKSMSYCPKCLAYNLGLGHAFGGCPHVFVDSCDNCDKVGYLIRKGNELMSLLHMRVLVEVFIVLCVVFVFKYFL